MCVWDERERRMAVTEPERSQCLSHRRRCQGWRDRKSIEEEESCFGSRAMALQSENIIHVMTAFTQNYCQPKCVSALILQYHYIKIYFRFQFSD